MSGLLARWKILFCAVVFFSVMGVIAVLAVVQGRESEEDHGNEIHEALEHNPGLLNDHSLPIAYVAEKLGQQGGEASSEILNGPSQEQYDARAFPHKWVAPAQQAAAANAFAIATARAQTAAGQSALKRAQGLPAAKGWTEKGPRGGIQSALTTYTGTRAIVSGRVTSLAITPPCTSVRCALYVGSAGGGLWKTTSALSDTPRWVPIGADIPSTAIGSISIAPDHTLYVGTGEPNGSSDSEAGVGLYRSTDGGASFTHVPTMVGGKDFALNRSIGTVVVDPSNHQHIYVGTAVARHGASAVNGGRFTPPGVAKVGIYESLDGGQTWKTSLTEDSDSVDPQSPNGSDFYRGGVTKIRFDPNHPGTVYAGMFDYGLFRRVGSGDWTSIYAIHNPGSTATTSTNRIEFTLAPLHTGKTRIYLGDSTYFNDTTAGLLRTDDATAAKPTWVSLSSSEDGTPGYGSYNFCEGQCYYDMVLASPPGRPNIVMLSGSMNYDELQAFGGPGNSNGRAVIRSTDAGVHFTDMTNDAQPHPNGLHPDQHALVFAPGSGGDVFFTGSDGGVVQQSGPFVNRSSLCAKRGLEGAQLADCKQFLSAVPTSNNNQINQGLATLQFESASSSPDGRILQGGTQDNGTWQGDRAAGWVETVGGDGGASGFNVDTTSIRYHSYYAPQHDVNFRSGAPNGWDWISDPLLGSGETASFYTPFLADPVTGGTVFDGLQHIWRTTDNGGAKTYLQEHCNELTGDFSVQCGDFQPLGGDLGDLSSSAWGGTTDTGNYVVAVERATSDSSTMWAATRYGRLFYSGNADAKNPDDVTYQQVDQKLGLPARFISGIAIDPADANHIFVSYSGYSAYRAGGHVYEVTWDPKKQTGTKKDLSYDLGDQPITDVVYSPTTGALFAATDFGVVTLPKGGSSWVATQGLPTVAVYGLTLSPSTKELLAATHGRGIWALAAN